MELRLATLQDAARILEIANEVFGQKQLLYSIYQAPNSVRHLERLIAAADPEHWISVVSSGDQLVGYYEAAIRSAEAFLNYIATEPRFEGNGVGGQMLRDLSSRARAARCSRLGLDVFQTNSRAVQWYRRLGFTQEREFTLARINLASIPDHASTPLLVDPDEYGKALENERRWGAGRFECDCQGAKLNVGVIGNHTCKLIAYSGTTLSKAVESIALLFRGSRDFLIVSVDDPRHLVWELASRETVSRLSVSLN